MLVTSYPVSCDWGPSKDVTTSNNLKIDTTDTSETDSDADTITTPAPALCSVSNTSMTKEMINIETTVSETFISNNNNDNNDTSDYFSTHFENDIQKLGTENDTTETFHDCHPSVSSSTSSRFLEHKDSLSGVKNKHSDPLTNGNVNRGLPSSSLPPDHEKCWTSTSPSSTPTSVSLLPSHRVTFNDKNEVASQDMDGTFTVTYSQLGEKITQKCSGEHLQKRPGGLKVQFGETSSVETVELPFKLPEYSISRNVTFDEDSLLSYKSKMVEEEWDNPFQPEGEVSQDAEKIIQLWRGGKLAEDEDLRENLNSLTPIPDLDKDKSNETSNESLQSDIRDSGSTDESDEKKIPNGVNGHANPKTSTPTKIPVINTSDMNYIVMVNNGTEKHKNKIKKHCSLM